MSAVIFLCLVIFAFGAADEHCKWRKNHIYYTISGDYLVHGISPETVKNCVRRAFNLYENSMLGYYFVNQNSVICEEADVEIIFESFGKKNGEFSLSKFNCTDDDEIAGELIQTIRSGEIHINSDVNYSCKHWYDGRGRLSQHGVNLFTTVLREIGHLIGLQDNDDVTSIVYKNADNFEYLQTHGALNTEDQKRINNLYI